MNKEKNFLSVVIYVHNAELTIGEYLREIIRMLDDKFEHSEIICVNDSSTDKSVEKIKQVNYNTKSVVLSVLNMSYFHGKEIAMNAGVDLSIGDFVLEIDHTNRDYDMLEIMKTYRKVMEGYDIVSASPNVKPRLTSAVFYKCFELFSSGKSKLYTESFRILSRRAINRVGQMSKTVPYRKGLYVNCGLKTNILVYQVVKASSQKNENNQIKNYRNYLAFDTLLLFTNAGFVFSKAMTLAMMCVSCFVLGYTIVVYFLGQPVVGWTTTLLFLSVAFLGLFGILTIVIKYLQLLIDLVFKRSKYSVESIEKLTK